MKTNNFFEDLKKYFKNTPREQVLADWAKSEECDKVGITVEEFLNNSQQYYKVHLKDPLDVGNNFNNDHLNPKYTSGFFLLNKFRLNAKSSVFN